MTRPCKSREDTAGNPTVKMHACRDETSKRTLCGLLVDPEWVDVVAGYATMCRTCYPRMREQAWTPDHDNPGDAIEGRGD
jgi:hypothetical protein